MNKTRLEDNGICDNVRLISVLCRTLVFDDVLAKSTGVFPVVYLHTHTKGVLMILSINTFVLVVFF
tara:strand:- start:277 stop:474 length:198 start_codon:yes stop_codon:yes gene_type:complete